MIEHDWSLWGSLAERYKAPRSRKMLSLDGGGVRGVLTLEILKRIEKVLKETLRADDSFRLSDYFDYIAGTSTGAIIATALARGLAVGEILDVYTTMVGDIFRPGPITSRWKSLYSTKSLEAELKKVFADGDGNLATLEPHCLRCLLMVVVKNISTDSAWPISSNPSAKYSHPSRPDCNLKIPLWQLVRASTAAPIYFPPEVIKLHPDDQQEHFVFADGSLTPFNNPAFQLFKMATTPEYCLGWATGENELLLVSIGTGKTPNAAPFKPNAFELPIWENIPNSFLGLLNSIQDEQDINCRSVGRCLHGPKIDSEVGDMVLPGTQPRLFTYVRYDADLSTKTLLNSGFSEHAVQNIRSIDKPQAVPDLLRIGAEAADQVQLEHFSRFLHTMTPSAR